MSTLVSLRNITKTYQRGPEKVQVLHGIDLDIASGDFVALMGPSGSGKTTLLNLIGGLDNPSGGEISIEGERIDQMSGGQLSTWRSHHVGFVADFVQSVEQCLQVHRAGPGCAAGAEGDRRTRLDRARGNR